MSSENIFTGLKVVDLASFIAGPGAATVLSDFGAEVIKVEPPGTGDPHRITYKTPPQPRSDVNYFWHLDNRNKRGIAVDLKAPQSRQILERLVSWADVLVPNFPQPVRKRLKLTYEDVASWNPCLISADITGYGDVGPDAELPGFDITAYWARSGLLAMTRDAGAPPTLPVAGSGDHATAIGLYAAIVTGLYRRERSGKGSYVTTSLIPEGASSCLMPVHAAPRAARFEIRGCSEASSEFHGADGDPGRGVSLPAAAALARSIGSRSHHVWGRAPTSRRDQRSAVAGERHYCAARRRRRAFEVNCKQPH